MSDNVLNQIIRKKELEVAQAKRAVSLAQLVKRLPDAPQIRDFLAALRAPESTPPSRQVKLIAEVKKASPSQGLIRADFDHVEIARAYEKAGASCVSVLTDESFFQGHLDFLKQIREAIRLPVLRKDFVIDEYQVVEARVSGADAVLLIAECLEDSQLDSLHKIILGLGMTPLVEFYEESNLDRVMAIDPVLIGVNNRDLKTFSVSIDHAIKMRSRIDPLIPMVAESGIFTLDDVRLLQQNQIQAMLVGQSLMEQPDIERATRALLGTTGPK